MMMRSRVLFGLVALALAATAPGCDEKTGWEEENFGCWPASGDDLTSPDCVGDNVCHPSLLRCMTPEQAAVLYNPYIPAKVDTAVGALDATEVTLAAYAQCIVKGECGVASCQSTAKDKPLPGGWTDQQPVSCVTYQEAEVFCAWTGGRLPTVDEWMESAGVGFSTGLPFPWGDTAPNCERAWFDAGDGAGCGTGFTAEVGQTLPTNGLYDMVGNVGEWTSTETAGLFHVVGGAYSSPASKIDLSLQGAAQTDPGERNPAIGFRCFYP